MACMDRKLTQLQKPGPPVPPKKPRKSKEDPGFVRGAPVWVKCPQFGWQKGIFQCDKSSHLVVTVGTNQKEKRSPENRFGQPFSDSTTETVQISADRVIRRDPSADLAVCQDLTKLTSLSEPAVLECLHRRYEDDVFYTSAGSTLVAINPFKEVAGLYGDDVIRRYHQKVEDEVLPAHVYAVAEDAYTKLRQGLSSTNQSVIVSGESGAGKTVTAKHLMKYVVTVSSQSESSRIPGEAVGSRIEQRILDSNPVLEAFGNASTARNHNSSRFGKYIELQFDRCGAIQGASIHTYLLEKTRVVHQADNEFNFHVFYQLLNGCSQAERQKWFLTDQSNFEIADCRNRKEDEDRTAWRNTCCSLEDLGLPAEHQEELFKVLCSLLHLGNVTFLSDEEDDDVCTCDVKSNTSRHGIQNFCRLLGLDQTELETALTYRKITASHSRRKSVFHKPCTKQGCISRRDCLAKLLYSRIFTWLVDFINHCIRATGEFSTIGLLDIYGFESFKKNSLEQLCINYANEKLQQHFVTHFLRELQTDYATEAIRWCPVSFTDNRPCLMILEGNPSVFCVLNEECQLNRSTDSLTVANRIREELKSHAAFTQSQHQVSLPTFTVKHYASPVAYTTEGILDKNKDNVPPELIQLLQRSENIFVAALFSDEDTAPSTKKRKTVLSKFKGSLDSLMSALETTDAHYIRCVKPNPTNQPGHFDRCYVLSQLEACGVVQTVKICQRGYPVRIRYDQFLKQYSLVLRGGSVSQRSAPAPLSSDENKENESMIDPLDALYQKQLNITPKRRSATPKRKLRRRAGLSNADHTRKLCSSILKMIFGTDFIGKDIPEVQFGRTKLFMKDGLIERLEQIRGRLLSQHAFTIQCAFRRHLCLKKKRELEAAVRIQSGVRGWFVRRELKRQHQAACRIQKWYCMILKVKSEVVNKVPPGGDKTSTGQPLMVEPDSVQSSVSASKSTSNQVTKETDACSPGIHIDSNGVNLDSPFRWNSTQKLTDSITSYPRFQACTAGIDDTKFELVWEQNEEVLVCYVKDTDRGSQQGLCILNRFDIYRKIAASMMASSLSRSRFHLAGAFSGIPYLEATTGLVSRRRMPRVQVRFHTRANKVLKCGHYIHQRELQCSLTDCLPGTD